MERYIEQLIEDIQKAAFNFRPPYVIWSQFKVNSANDLELEDVATIEKQVNDKKKPLSTITGFDFGLLPPSGKLNSPQMARLAAELEKLLQIFHFALDFPENYPADLRYPFILMIWDKKFVPMPFGDFHIGFCDMKEDECPFPGYCTTCKDIVVQMKPDEETGHSARCFQEDKLLYFEDINGFYDDNGNKIDLYDHPIPDLCKICKSYHIDDWDENLLCMMNRRDQRNDTHFMCGAFDKLQGI